MSAKISNEARVSEYFRTAPLDKAETMLEIAKQTMRNRKAESAPSGKVAPKKAITRKRTPAKAVPNEEQTRLTGVGTGE